MRKLTMLAVLLGALLWCQAAFAQYSALEDHPGSDVSVGVGGLALSGGGSGADGSEFVPTISLTGITDMVVWQAFYGFGDASVFGGSVDYVFADNFDNCDSCAESDLWWFGGGLSLISYSDLFASGTTTAGLSDTEAGLNIGGGTRWDDWGLDVYLHYFPSNEILGIQGQLLYNFN